MSTNIKSPLFILGVAPVSKGELPNFLQEDQKFVKLLENPPSLRYMGWNMGTLDHPKIVDGQSWEVRNGDIKTIRLYRDGSLVAVVYADNSFLGWGQSDEDFAQNPRLNTLALLEYVYEFIELYRKILEHFPQTKEIKFEVGLKNAKVGDKWLHLIPQKIEDPFYFAGFDKGTIKNDFDMNVLIETEDQKIYDSRYVAYKILMEIFGKFGIPANKIPYIGTDDNGLNFLDVSKFPKN